MKKQIFLIICAVGLAASAAFFVTRNVGIGDVSYDLSQAEQTMPEDISLVEASETPDEEEKEEISEEEALKNKSIPKIFDDPEKQKRAEEAAEKEIALKSFLIDYPNNNGRVTGGYTEEELAAEHPHFLQYDKRWGYYEYGDSCIGFAGCAPTAMAMVCLELVKNPKVTPNVIADYAMEHGMYTKGIGTSWNFFTSCEQFGVRGRILPFSKAGMEAELDAGHPIIISLRPGDFTDNGHIAVIASYTDEGFIVSDPGSNIRTQRTWDFETLIPQIKQLWVYTKV